MKKRKIPSDASFKDASFTLSYPARRMIDGTSGRSRTLAVEKVCEECGETFTARTSVTRFCSNKCNQRHYYRFHKRAEVSKRKCKKAAQAPPDDLDILTIKQFCQRLGVCKQTVYNMDKAGDVRIIRMSRRRVFIRWSEFEAKLNGNTVPKTQQVPHNFYTTISNPVETPPQTTPEIQLSAPVSTVITSPFENEWIDMEAACERYSLQPGSFYNFVSVNKIPTKNDFKRRLYSTSAMDKIRSYKYIPAGYISLFTASKKYRISISTLRRNLHKFQIPLLKSNSKIYFPESDLSTILSKQII